MAWPHYLPSQLQPCRPCYLPGYPCPCSSTNSRWTIGVLVGGWWSIELRARLQSVPSDTSRYDTHIYQKQKPYCTQHKLQFICYMEIGVYRHVALHGIFGLALVPTTCLLDASLLFLLFLHRYKATLWLVLCDAGPDPVSCWISSKSPMLFIC